MQISPPSNDMRRAVFLDRDGVINRATVRDGKPYPPRSTEQTEILPGTGEALERLKRLGFLLIVVTNQPDVARGTQSRAEVDRIHAALSAQLPLDAFFVCDHDDRDGCVCRKPKPGLLLAAAAQYGVSLEASFLVGDRWRDVDAGHAAGCKAIWIDYGYRERGPGAPPARKVTSLAEAVEWICEQSRIQSV
jgi:D-glycero-D-manno-heptose 1,7-bisphosphate phosphatase